MTMTYHLEESKSSIIECLAELIGQANLVRCDGFLRWVLEASDQYTGNHGIHGSADPNLEQIR